MLTYPVVYAPPRLPYVYSFSSHRYFIYSWHRTVNILHSVYFYACLYLLFLLLTLKHRLDSLYGEENTTGTLKCADCCVGAPSVHLTEKEFGFCAGDLHAFINSVCVFGKTSAVSSAWYCPLFPISVVLWFKGYKQSSEILNKRRSAFSFLESVPVLRYRNPRSVSSVFLKGASEIVPFFFFSISSLKYVLLKFCGPLCS